MMINDWHATENLIPFSKYTVQFREWLLEEVKGSNYTYSSTQINLPKGLADEIMAWCRKHIPENEIYHDEDGGLGREDEIHVTVLYGLHDSSPKKVARVLEHTKPFEIKLGKISVFTNPDAFDVVKIEVDSQKLHSLNKQFKQFDHTNNYPNYSPHVTIAYVKKGKGWKHGGNSTFRGRHFTADHVVFSSRSGKKTRIGLN